MANYAPDRPGVTGVAPVVHTAASADSVENNGRVLVRVANGGGSPINVTFDDPNSVNPGSATSFNPDVVNSVTNGTQKVFGPFPPARFNDVNGRLQMAFSAITSVTWEAYEAGA